MHIFGAEIATIFRGKYEKSRACGIAHVMQSHLRLLLSFAASQNARESVCKQIFAFAASIFQIFGAENAAIFRGKFADRARSALHIRQNRIGRLCSSSSRRALPSRLRENFLKLNFRVCGGDFSHFRRRKRSNFSRKKSKIARVRRCARHAIAVAFARIIRCFSICVRIFLQTNFCICGIDFSNF